MARPLHPRDSFDFYPRPPRGGRQIKVMVGGTEIEFLSTSSARRTTANGMTQPRVIAIFLSTSSARRTTKSVWVRLRRQAYFYPRPPRGGRPSAFKKVSSAALFLSTSSARRTTPPVWLRPRPERISIHVLREEDDMYPVLLTTQRFTFLSTSSARRTTGRHVYIAVDDQHFYPRPPRGGRLHFVLRDNPGLSISIHVLREEDDMSMLSRTLAHLAFLSTSSARRTTAGTST